MLNNIDTNSKLIGSIIDVLKTDREFFDVIFRILLNNLNMIDYHSERLNRIEKVLHENKALQLQNDEEMKQHHEFIKRNHEEIKNLCKVIEGVMSDIDENEDNN